MAGNSPAGAGGKARYAQLAESLLQKIGTGDYPVGTLMPTEFDLCRQFGVSRTTVREAMRHLSDMGLVTRRAGVGTLVRARYVSPRYVHAIESISDIFQYTQGSSKPVVLGVEEIEAGKHEASLLQCSPGQRWIKFGTLRTFAGKRVPMVLTEAYVPPTYARLPKLAEKRREPMYVVLESEFGESITEVQQEFRALQLNTKQASLLEVKPRSAGLYAIRHYFGSGGRLLLVSLSIYPSDRFSYAMRLRYNGQARKELG